MYGIKVIIGELQGQNRLLDISDLVSEVRIIFSLEKPASCEVGLSSTPDFFDLFLGEGVPIVVVLSDLETNTQVSFSGVIGAITTEVGGSVLTRLTALDVNVNLVNWHSYRAKLKKKVPSAKERVIEGTPKHIFIFDWMKNSSLREWVPVPAVFRENSGGNLEVSTAYEAAEGRKRRTTASKVYYYKTRNSRIVKYFADQMKEKGLLAGYYVVKSKAPPSLDERDEGQDVQAPNQTDSQFLMRLAAEEGCIFMIKSVVKEDKKVESYLFYFPISFSSNRIKARAIGFGDIPADATVIGKVEFQLGVAGKKFSRIGLPVWRLIDEVSTKELKEVMVDKAEVKQIFNVLVAPRVSIVSDLGWFIGLPVILMGQVPGRFGPGIDEEKKKLWFVTQVVFSFNASSKKLGIDLELTAPAFDKYSSVFATPNKVERLKQGDTLFVLPSAQVEPGSISYEQASKIYQEGLVGSIW